MKALCLIGSLLLVVSYAYKLEQVYTIGADGCTEVGDGKCKYMVTLEPAQAINQLKVTMTATSAIPAGSQATYQWMAIAFTEKDAMQNANFAECLVAKEGAQGEPSNTFLSYVEEDRTLYKRVTNEISAAEQLSVVSPPTTTYSNGLYTCEFTYATDKSFVDGTKIFARSLNQNLNVLIAFGEANSAAADVRITKHADGNMRKFPTGVNLQTTLRPTLQFKFKGPADTDCDATTDQSDKQCRMWAVIDRFGQDETQVSVMLTAKAKPVPDPVPAGQYLNIGFSDTAEMPTSSFAECRIPLATPTTAGSRTLISHVAEDRLQYALVPTNQIAHAEVVGAPSAVTLADGFYSCSFTYKVNVDKTDADNIFVRKLDSEKVILLAFGHTASVTENRIDKHGDQDRSGVGKENIVAKLKLGPEPTQQPTTAAPPPATTKGTPRPSQAAVWLLLLLLPLFGILTRLC